MRLLAKEVSDIKRRYVEDGESVATIARRYRIGYMVIYKILTGETWESVEPVGRLLKLRSKNGINRKQRDKLYRVKRKTGASNALLALKSKRPESSVSKAIRDAELVLALRVHKSLIASGCHRKAVKKFGITEDEAVQLVALARTRKISATLREEVDG